MTPAISFRNVTKTFPRLDRAALSGLTFDLRGDACVGLLGPNGAGKTTIVRLVAGVIAPTAGEVVVLGSDPSGRSRRSLQSKLKIGVVHQHPAFELMLTAGDNLSIAARLKQLPRKSSARIISSLAEEFGIADALKQLAYTLSGGQRKRLAVVRALLGDPRLLIVDEPSSGLDVEGRRRVWSMISEARADRQISILWTSHDMQEVERNCEELIVICEGRLVKQGVTRNILSSRRPVAVLEMNDARTARAFGEVLGSHLSLNPTQIGAQLELTLPETLEIADVVRVAADGQYSILSFRQRDPNLEDVFIEMTRREAAP